MLAQGRGEGIDRRIESDSSRRLRLLVWIGACLALGASSVAALMLLVGAQRPSVARSNLTIAEARLATFRESISVTGAVRPRTTVYLDAVEGGRIEEILVQEGGLVSAGQPLLRLSNNDLQLRLIAIEAQRLEQVNRLRDMRFRLREKDLELQQQFADMDFHIQQMQRQTARNQKLYKHQLISEQEKEQIEAELQYLREKRQIALSAYRQDAEHQAARIQQMEAERQQMEAIYALIQKALDALVIKAPIDGQLTSLSAEIGELKPSGSRFGQIDNLRDGYKVRAAVDEYYLDRVTRGMPAVTLPISGKRYELAVSRVYPEVREGKFTFDLEFGGDQPGGLRTGQTVGFQLRLGSAEKTLVLPRGPYYQTSGGQWVYVLEGDDIARRRSIRPGRLSAESLEIVEGLKPGDKVITSSYKLLKEHREISLR